MLGGLMVLALFMGILLICAFMLHQWGLTGLLSQDPETLTLTPEQAQGFLLCLLLLCSSNLLKNLPIDVHKRYL